MQDDGGRMLLEDMKSKSMRPYNYSAIKNVHQGKSVLLEKMDAIKRRAELLEKVDEELSINFILHKYQSERDDRIRRTYHFKRSQYINEAYFTKLCDLSLLSSDEMLYKERLDGYLDERLADFEILDFSQREPPLDFFCQIVTVEDCGVIVDDGVVMELKKGRIYFLKKKCILHLLESNVAKIL